MARTQPPQTQDKGRRDDPRHRHDQDIARTPPDQGRDAAQRNRAGRDQDRDGVVGSENDDNG